MRTPLRFVSLFLLSALAYVVALFADLTWLSTLLWLPIVIFATLYVVTATRAHRRERMIIRRARAVRRIQGGAR